MTVQGASVYQPFLNPIGDDRNTLVKRYFDLGLQYKEILEFLDTLHGIKLSLRHLKRILQSMGLQRRKGHASIDDIAALIEYELQGNGSCLGYRQMTQKLRLQYGLVVHRETVRLTLKTLDPEGVEYRARRKLKRRLYSAKGPNFIWHIDGYDKLKPFGFAIHGAIDGYSRRIMWLEVGPSNNDPKVTAKYFIDCLRSTKGAPKFVRADCGTENVFIAGIQRFIRRDCVDVISGEKCFLYGKSVSNQRIEAWWSFLRKSYSNWWMNYFKDLRDTGLYDDSDNFQVECLRFCFMPLIQTELNDVVKNWNLHQIRPSKNRESPPGKPDVLYFLPERNSTRDYSSGVVIDDLDLAEENYSATRPELGCTDEFRELATMIMEDHGYNMPHDHEDSRTLYLDLLRHINAI